MISTIKKEENKMQMEVGEKREFLRVDYETPLQFKTLRDNKLTQRSEIFSRNVSACGLLFRTTDQSSIPALSSIIWVELDEKMVNICAEIENDLVIHNNGIFARVVRISEGEPGESYDIGVCFLRKKDLLKNEINELVAT